MLLKFEPACDRGTVFIRTIPDIVGGDDQCNVCMAQPRQLVCLFHQVGFPSGELLRLGFCCIWHFMRSLHSFDTDEMNRINDGCKAVG